MADAPRELEIEIRYFEANLENWLKDHQGKFALVKGEELIGTFDNPENAYIAGVQKFGNVPFLIRRITGQDTTVHLPALTLGLLRANV